MQTITSISYGKVKDTVDFIQIEDQDGCWASHLVEFTHEDVEYTGLLQADANLNGTIYDEELIESIEKK